MVFFCNKGKHLFQGTRFLPEMLQKMREWRGLPQGTIKGYSRDLVVLNGKMLHPDYPTRTSAAQILAECTISKRKDI